MKTSFSRSARNLSDNIKLDITELRREGVNCTELAQDRAQLRTVWNTIEEIWVP
jgi:hypothetical protein